MKIRFQHREQVFEVELERRDHGIAARVDGQPVDVELLDQQPGQVSLRVNGQPVTVYMAGDGASQWVSSGGCAFRLERPTPRRARHSGDQSSGESIRAPMPAQVRAVQVQAGDSVEKGQVLLLLEAMKMEIRVKSPAAGRVARLAVKAGQAVEKDQLLVEVEAIQPANFSMEEETTIDQEDTSGKR